MNKPNIAISILNADKKEEFLKELKVICKKKKLDNISIHIDVMDGKFVPNHGVDLKYSLTAHKLGFYTDVHLMVESPDEFIQKSIEYGVDNITVHYEIENLTDVLTRLNLFKKQKKLANIGLAIKPGTDISTINEYLYLVDTILVMTVEPGKGMQEYMKECEKKLSVSTAMNKVFQVDGGVNETTIISAKKAGATSFVVGSYLTKNITELESRIDKLEEVIRGK